MRQFFIFIRQYSNSLLFLALLVTCIIIIANSNYLQGNAVLNSANYVSGKVYERQERVQYYFRLREMNDSLIHENLRLQNELVQRQTYDTLKQFTVRDTFSVTQQDDTLRKVIQYTDYIYRSAMVISNSVASENNYITIDRGHNDGVKPNMAVVSGSGVVGKVVRTSAHYAVVLTALSEVLPISSQLKDGTTGLVKWEGKRPEVLQMLNVPSELSVKVGDTVTTTPYSFFPAYVPVGRVTLVMKSKKTGMKVLYLKPFTDFRKVQHVYTIENTGYAEKQQLLDSVLAKP